MTEQEAMLNAQWGDGGGSSWAGFFQDLTKTVVGGYATVEQQRQQNSFQLAQEKIRYLGQDGYYTAGQPNQPRTGINSSTLLLIGGALLVYMLVKD